MEVKIASYAKKTSPKVHHKATQDTPAELAPPWKTSDTVWLVSSQNNIRDTI
jgi:hypothetical protein